MFPLLYFQVKRLAILKFLFLVLFFSPESIFLKAQVIVSQKGNEKKHIYLPGYFYFGWQVP